MGELVRLADDEGLEGEARLERRGRSRRWRSSAGGGSFGAGRAPLRRNARLPAARAARSAPPAARPGCRPGGWRGPRPATARSAGRRSGSGPSRAGSGSAAWTVTSSPSTPRGSCCRSQERYSTSPTSSGGDRGCGPIGRPDGTAGMSLAGRWTGIVSCSMRPLTPLCVTRRTAVPPEPIRSVLAG